MKLAVLPLSAKLTVKLFVILLPVTFDVVANKLAETVLAETTLAPVTLLSIKVRFPVAVKVPDTLTPVPVITIVVLPTAVKLILPLALGIFTLLFPLANVPNIFPAVILPETFNEINVPTLVMFGCALSVTVPALTALLAATPVNRLPFPI